MSMVIRAGVASRVEQNAVMKGREMAMVGILSNDKHS
jgi:hypothetical protein